MGFSETETATLLVLKGVGPRVIERLEQLGLNNFLQLADADAKDILEQCAALTGSTCWKNSPQSKAAVAAAIGAAAGSLNTTCS